MIKHERFSLTTSLNTEKTVKNTTRCGICLTNFDELRGRTREISGFNDRNWLFKGALATL